MKTNWKKGDIGWIASEKGNGGHGFDTGTKIEISFVYNEGTDQQHYQANSDDDYWWVVDSDLTDVEPTNQQQ